MPVLPIVPPGGLWPPNARGDSGLGCTQMGAAHVREISHPLRPIGRGVTGERAGPRTMTPAARAETPRSRVVDAAVAAVKGRARAGAPIPNFAMPGSESRQRDFVRAAIGHGTPLSDRQADAARARLRDA
jgi:hypothetical protein